MRIGILGGTGPAGSALGARLASIGYEVVLGSRSRYRALEAVDNIIAEHPGYQLSIRAGDNHDAARCDVVVIATPWDSAATTATEHEADLALVLVLDHVGANDAPDLFVADEGAEQHGQRHGR